MAKKRRHAAAPAAQRASAAANKAASVDPEVVVTSLGTLNVYYDQLSSEVVGIPASLERTLLFHSLVALVVQNALMVVQQSVSTAQMMLVAGTAVWMTRKSFVGMFLPHAALQNTTSREVILRAAFLLLTLGGLGVVYYRVKLPLETLQLVLFAAVVLLDVVSTWLVVRARGRLLRRQIALSAIEATFLSAGFSTCLSHKRGLIFDEMAFALTAATTFVHVVVLLSAKYVVLHCFASDTNSAFMNTQQRAAKLLAEIWQDIDRYESEHLLLGLSGASKKKKAKAKSRASSSKVTSTDTEEPDNQAKQSMFKDPRVQLAILTLIQMLLLLSQLALSTLVLHSWEMMSALMLSSSHVLWILGRVRRKVLAHSTTRSTGQKLKSE